MERGSLAVLRLFLAVRFDPCAAQLQPAPRRRRPAADTLDTTATSTAPSSQVPTAAPAAEEPECIERGTVVREDPQVLALRAFATSLGFTLQKNDTWRLELASQIASKMANRLGGLVYQSAAFSIPCFPQMCAEQLLPDSLIQKKTPTMITWTASTAP